jgi:mycothiol synthase
MKSSQKHDWIIRPATHEDIDGVCEIINAYSLAIFGISNDAKRNVELTWGQPGFQLETDTRVAVHTDGRIVGYSEVGDTEEPHIKIWSWLRVHPEFRGQELEDELLSWIEDRARDAIVKAPPQARVVVTQGIPDEDTAVQALFRERGFSIIRHFWRMTIELVHDIPEPVWSDGVTVRTFVLEEDLEETVRAFRDSFQDHWGHIDKPFEEELKQWDHWIRNDEEFDPTLTFLAVAGDEIVGLASCDPKFSEDPEMGFVDVLGVRRAWRRRGIALALLHHAFREFKKRGQQRVGLGVDSTSLTGANRLYEEVGMRSTRQTSAFEKELRAGVDLSLQTLDGDSAS